MTIFNCNYSFGQIIDEVCKFIIKSFPKFYHDLFKVWFDTKTVLRDTAFSKSQHQVIWNNSMVKIIPLISLQEYKSYRV